MKTLLAVILISILPFLGFAQQTNIKMRVEPKIGNLEPQSTVTLQEILDADTIYVYDVNNKTNYVVTNFQYAAILSDNPVIQEVKSNKVKVTFLNENTKTIIYSNIQYRLPNGEIALCPRSFTLNISDEK